MTGNHQYKGKRLETSPCVPTSLLLDLSSALPYNSRMKRGARTDWRRVVNIVLPVVILADMIFYQFCLTSCAYLQGDILGFNMKYVGLIIPLPLIALGILKLDFLYLLALGFGIGGELKLVWFQVQTQVYCPYCLFAAAVIFFLFFLNFRRSRAVPALSFVVIGFIFFQLFFHGTVTPSY